MEEYEKQIAYIHGQVETLIDGYAKAMGIASIVLAERVATLLHPGGPRGKDPMPSVRRKTARLLPAAREVEVAHHAHGKKASGGSGAGLRAYWANMSPAQREAEKARRNATRRKNKLAKAA